MRTLRSVLIRLCLVYVMVLLEVGMVVAAAIVHMGWAGVNGACRA